MILNVTGNHISKTFQYLLYEFQLLFDLLLDIQCSLIYLWVTKKGRKSKIWKGISCNKRHGEEERITSIIRNGINQKREKKKMKHQMEKRISKTRTETYIFGDDELDFQLGT